MNSRIKLVKLYLFFSWIMIGMAIPVLNHLLLLGSV